MPRWRLRALPKRATAYSLGSTPTAHALRSLSSSPLPRGWRLELHAGNFPVNDLRAYQRIGDKGTELTGYPNISIFHEFRDEPKEFVTGTFDDWKKTVQLEKEDGIFKKSVELPKTKTQYKVCSRRDTRLPPSSAAGSSHCDAC